MSGEPAAYVVNEPGGNLTLDLFVLSQHVGGLIDEALAGTGLSASLYALYSHLTRGGRTPKQLAGALGIAPATLSGYLAQMERAGHLTRERSVADGRSWTASLTAEGSAKVRECQPRFRVAVERLNLALGGEEEVHRARQGLGALDRAVIASLEVGPLEGGPLSTSRGPA